jgi:hypothetical protein
MKFISKIKGKFICSCENDANKCKRFIHSYGISYTTEGSVITIDTEKYVTPLFDRDGFERHVLNITRRYSDPAFEVGEMEEKDNENTTRLLRK